MASRAFVGGPLPRQGAPGAVLLPTPPTVGYRFARKKNGLYVHHDASPWHPMESKEPDKENPLLLDDSMHMYDILGNVN